MTGLLTNCITLLSTYFQLAILHLEIWGFIPNCFSGVHFSRITRFRGAHSNHWATLLIYFTCFSLSMSFLNSGSQSWVQYSRWAVTKTKYTLLALHTILLLMGPRIILVIFFVTTSIVFVITSLVDLCLVCGPAKTLNLLSHILPLSHVAPIP